MKSNFLISLLLFLFSSCVFDEGNSSRQFYNQLPKPLTKKEKWFVSKLKNKGFYKLKIRSPYIGELAPGLSIYSLTMESNDIANSKNIDSIKKSLFFIAKHLYNNVIEDSIRDEIGDISICWKLQSNGMSYKKIELNATYDIKELVFSDTIPESIVANRNKGTNWNLLK